MTVKGLLELLGDNVRSPEELEEILRPLLLPRKSSEIGIGDDRSNPILLAVESSTKEWLEEVIARQYEDDETREQQAAMDKHWSAQKSSFLYFIHNDKGYHEFLPGRLYMYLQLAERISAYWGMCRSEYGEHPRSVELGCGSATLSQILAKKTGVTADVVDLSAGALRYAVFLAENQFDTKGLIHTQREDMFSYGAEEPYAIAMNSGVFEHLTTEEQEKLIDRMAALVQPEGLVVVAVPNPDSPLYLASKEVEEQKGWFEFIKEYLYPQPHRDQVDIPALFEHAGLRILEHGGVSLAPSVVTKKFCSKSAGEIYNGSIERFNPENVEAKIKLWQQFEQIIRHGNPELLKNNAWYHYAIGVKEVDSS